jgi:enoyl-CoA hydratase
VTTETADVLIERTGVVGTIVLNRPKAINALTHGMVTRIDSALRAWAEDPGVGAVVVTGAGERGLCAGGDLRGIYEDVLTGGTATSTFWRDEYRLNALIARYPKPYVVVMDGLVMGGGVGLSAHGSFRVVTERTVLAMPEVGIGLVPDVGGSWLLARAPGELGLHAALSGCRLSPGDAIEMGFADWYVPTERIRGLLGALRDIPVTEDDVVSAVGERIHTAALARPAGELATQRHWIDRCYAAETAEEIVTLLAAAGDAAAEDTAKEIGRKSPTAVKVALRAVRTARRLGSLEEALVQEFRVSMQCFTAPDLAEGIRAQVIDKDRSPQWRPAVLERVTEDQVDCYFDPLDQDLILPESDLGAAR